MSTEIKGRDEITRLALWLALLWSLGSVLAIVLLFAGADGTGRMGIWIVIATFPILMSALVWTALFSPQRRDPGEPISDMVWGFQLRRAERSLRKIKSRGVAPRDVLDGGDGAEWMEKYCFDDRELAGEAFRRVYGDSSVLSLGVEDEER